MRLALLSNVTIDLLAGVLKKQAEVYLSAGFDTWQQELLTPTSNLYDFNPESVSILLHADAYNWIDSEKGCLIIDEWCNAFKVFSINRPSIPLFVSSIDVFDSNCQFGAEVRLGQFFENYLIERVQRMHDEGCSIYILPAKDCIIEMGRSTFYSTKMWYLGSMPYSMKGILALSEMILRYASATKGMLKKCIAVDLDNTLWGGVIGEDGVEGIVLSNHKEGERYFDTQRMLKKMKEQGVMIAIISKNNVDDVEAVFKHPYMVLQHEDFVAEVLNWESKTNNIRQLAKNLNIGLDAFVFLDDNPAEREQMKAECSEVTVIDFPKDSSQLPTILQKAYYNYFFSLEVTKEDVKKTEMYRTENLRRVEKSSSTSVEDFLKKLEMRMDIHFMKSEEEKRVAQLANKTNQFNVTTKRYSEGDIHELSISEYSDVLTVHIADRYGDQGLVAVLILKYRDDVAVIDSFFMSCRVMGRNVEYEVAAQIKKLLELKGIKRIMAKYIKTAKNAPVLNLFDKLGFTRVCGEIYGIGDWKDYEIEVRLLPDTTGVFKIIGDSL